MTAFLSFIYGLVSSLPWLEAKIDALIAAYQNIQKQAQNARISQATKDMNAAKTDDEIKKAADETGDSIRHL
jgi:hypothetical protein